MTSRAIGVLLVALAAGGMAAQRQPLTFGSGIGVVILQATVTNGRGQQVTDLSKDAFTVFENGHREELTIFKHDIVPVSVGLVIDDSRSMRDHRLGVEAAGLVAARSINSEDEIFVVRFADRAKVEVDMTNRPEKAIQGLRLNAIGGTGLRDAIALAENYLVLHASKERRALLVLSDGNDNASEASEDQIKDVAEKNGILVYALGLLDEVDAAKAAHGREALEGLADRSGGRALCVAAQGEAEAVARDLMSQMRHRYTLGYLPQAQAPDGTYRTLKVVAKGGERLRVTTRKGYRATLAR